MPNADALHDCLAMPDAAGAASPVDAILDAVREHLGMEIAFASRFDGDRRRFTHIRATIPVPAAPGDSEPLEDSFCHHILEGRLPQLIHDAHDYELALSLPITRALPVGAHLNVPLRLADGSVYGTFCCLSRSPDRSLTERDLNILRAFADLAAAQIERELVDERIHSDVSKLIANIIESQRVSMVFQPIHRLSDGRPVGVESLARFADGAEAGWSIPSDWFLAAANVGLGVDLELLAIRQALRCLPYIPKPLYVSVNVSPETAMSARLTALLDETGCDRLVIELTEHAEVDDYRALSNALDGLRKRARIAIDDVGAGYSGLRQIVDLKPDLLKLDMGLTRDIDGDEARRALGQAMVSFAKRTGSTIIAEGVETAEEANSLRSIGVRYGQGFRLSRPMPAVAAQQFLLGARNPRPMPRPRRSAKAA